MNTLVINKNEDVLKTIIEIDIDNRILIDYQLKMLANTKKYFLKPTLSEMDNKKFLKYDISGLIDLKSYLDNNLLTKEGFIRVFNEIVSIFKESKKMLLNYDKIILTLDNIYLDNDKKIKVIYIPINEVRNSKESLKSLILSLLSRLSKYEKSDFKIFTDLILYINADNFNIFNMHEIIEEYVVDENNNNAIKTAIDKSKKLNKYKLKVDLFRNSEIGKIVAIEILIFIVLIIFIYMFTRKYGFKNNIDKILGLLVFVSGINYIFIDMKLNNNKQNALENNTKSEQVDDNTIVINSLLFLEIGSEKVPVESDRFTIGKSDNVDFTIKNKTVSRRHLEIQRIDNEYYIKDLNSKNSTYLNDEKIERDNIVKINDGDEILLSNEKIKVVIR